MDANAIFEEELARRGVAFERAGADDYRTAPDQAVTYVSPDMCERWGVSTESAIATALANQDGLLRGIELQVDDVDGHKLGMVPLDSAFKASVIFAPSLKAFVSPVLGWPVLAVIPCRDFIYVLPDNSPLLGRIGSVVVKEFRTSGYPITTEVYRISDEGIEAIGKFPTGDQE